MDEASKVVTRLWSDSLEAPQVLAALRQLQPRLYSISSSQAEAETRVQVGAGQYANCCAMPQTARGMCSPGLAPSLQVACMVDMRLS